MAIKQHKKGTQQETNTPFEPKDWQCLSVLALLVLIFFQGILLGHSYFWEDFLYHDYPSRDFAAVSMANGEIPLWNPYSFNGMPFLADIQKTVFYLPCVFLTPFVSGGTLSPYWLEVMIILHYVLAGAGMFYLARSFDLRRIPSLFSGAAYALSGFMIMHAIHQYIVTLVAWYPLVLLLFRKALAGPWKWVFLCALVLGHSTLAGFPQLTLYVYFFLFVFFVFELLTTYGWRNLTTRPSLIATSKAATVIVLSIAIAAIQLLPTLEFADLTFRAQITYQKATEGQFSWEQLVTLLYPKFFGTAGAGGYNYHGPGTYWYYWETCMYLGILPLMLLSISSTLIRKSKYIAFFFGFGIFAVLFALGDNFIVHKFFFDFVPRFSTFRNPARMSIFLAFGAALLAGFALQHILYSLKTSQESKRLRAVIGTIMGASVLLYLLLVSGSLTGTFKFLDDRTIATPILSDALVSLLVCLISGTFLVLILNKGFFFRWAGFAAVGLFLIDMAVFGGNQNNSKVNPTDYFNRARAVVDFIKQDSKGEIVRLNMRNQQGMLMDRNQGLMDRIMLMEGYTPLVLQRYLPPSRNWSQTCDMMNAKYRVATDTLHNTLTLQRATTYLPRAYMVYDARILTDSANIFRFMQSDGFEPARTVVIDSDPGFPVQDTSYHTDWQAEFTNYSLNAMALNVSTPKDGFLVFSEIYYPGWVARVDGTEQTIYRADWNQRVIPMRSGSHHVEMHFESPTFKRGTWITLITLALCVVGTVSPSLKKNTSPSQQS